jgi:hypothetical protein
VQRPRGGSEATVAIVERVGVGSWEEGPDQGGTCSLKYGRGLLSEEKRVQQRGLEQGSDII